MGPRLLKIKTPLGEFDIAPYSGRNESGYQPTGDRVLILPDQCAEQTSGGLYLDPTTMERITAASETGILAAMGDMAFDKTARGRQWTGRKPAIGDRVYFERYAGVILVGDDGKTYRVMDDDAVAAIRRPMTEEAAAAA